MDRLDFGLEIFDNCQNGNRIINCTDTKKLRAMLDSAMIATLTDKQRCIVTMFYFENMSVTQIAYTLKLNKSTVSRHLSKSKEKLKSYIKYGTYRLWRRSRLCV